MYPSVSLLGDRTWQSISYHYLEREQPWPLRADQKHRESEGCQAVCKITNRLGAYMSACMAHTWAVIHELVCMHNSALFLPFFVYLYLSLYLFYVFLFNLSVYPSSHCMFLSFFLSVFDFFQTFFLTFPIVSFMFFTFHLTYHISFSILLSFC